MEVLISQKVNGDSEKPMKYELAMFILNYRLLQFNTISETGQFYRLFYRQIYVL